MAEEQSKVNKELDKAFKNGDIEYIKNLYGDNSDTIYHLYKSNYLNEEKLKFLLYNNFNISKNSLLIFVKDNKKEFFKLIIDSILSKKNIILNM